MAQFAFFFKKECWRHYERAHIIGQRYPLQHSYVHWKMLRFVIKIKSTNTLYFEKIDVVNKILQTKEWDDAAKIWNHKISFKTLTSNCIYYEDEIIIYGGILTGIITAWAILFYKFRQKRWQIIIKKNIQFK